METGVLSRLGAGHASRCSHSASPVPASSCLFHASDSTSVGLGRAGEAGWEGLGTTHVRRRDSTLPKTETEAFR